MRLDGCVLILRVLRWHGRWLGEHHITIYDASKINQLLFVVRLITQLCDIFKDL